MEVLKSVASRYSPIVVIGSTQVSHTPDNPFTAGERYEMIQASALEESIPVRIVPVQDINRYAVWVSHVVSLVPPFEVVCTNNPLTKRLFQEAGYEVETQELFDRHRFEGARIRRLMSTGDSTWRKLVPPAVVEVVERVGGEERMRVLSETDRFRAGESEY
jgi:nicotinamide-nucleotide adenylyltransferase